MDELRIDIVDGELTTSGFDLRTVPRPNATAVVLSPLVDTGADPGELYTRLLATTANPVAFLESVEPVSGAGPPLLQVGLDEDGRVPGSRRPAGEIEVRTLWEADPQTLSVDPRTPVATVLLERALRQRGARIQRTHRNFLVGSAPDGRPLLAKDARTDLNGLPAVRAAERKDVARALLARAGVAIPDGAAFDSAAPPAEALALLARLGSLVVKPVDGDKGRGVTVGVSDADRLRAAWELARRETGAGILVEEVRSGEEVRVLVIDGRARAVARRIPPFVIGDGVRTIRELINEKNAQRRTSFFLQGKPIVLTPHRLHLLAGAGLTPLSVLHGGQRCDLDVTGNVRTGAEPVDATDTIDASYLRIAERAVSAIPGLRCAGVDLICEDLESPAGAGDHVVLELNPNPGIGIHAGARGGERRDVAGAIADAVLGAVVPRPAAPATAVATIRAESPASKATSEGLLAAAFRARGFTVDWVSPRGFFAQRGENVHGVWGATTDRTAHAAVFALGNPNAAHGLLEHAAVPVLQGRGFSRYEREDARAYAAQWERVAVHGGTRIPIMVESASSNDFAAAWDEAAAQATVLGMRVTPAPTGPSTRLLVAQGEVLAVRGEASVPHAPGAQAVAERSTERALALAAVAALPGLDLAEVVVAPTAEGARVVHVRADPELAAFVVPDALPAAHIADQIVAVHTGACGG